MEVYYIIAKNGKKYYFKDGKSISAEEGIRLGALPQKKKIKPLPSSSIPSPPLPPLSSSSIPSPPLPPPSIPSPPLLPSSIPSPPLPPSSIPSPPLPPSSIPSPPLPPPSIPSPPSPPLPPSSIPSPPLPPSSIPSPPSPPLPPSSIPSPPLPPSSMLLPQKQQLPPPISSIPLPSTLLKQTIVPLQPPIPKKLLGTSKISQRLQKDAPSIIPVLITEYTEEDRERDIQLGLKPCKPHQYRHPVTNRCVNRPDYKRDRSRGDKRTPCKEYQYRDPITGRCKNNPDYKRERPRIRDPVPRKLLPPRWQYNEALATDCVKRSNLPLRDVQLKVVTYMEDHDSLLVIHGTGTGKCHGIDTPILMYDGNIKMVQDIQVGEKIMGMDSKPRKVLSLARGQEEMYKIIQHNGGKDYTVNASHILTMKLSQSKGMYYTTNRNVDYIVVKYFDVDNFKRNSKWFKLTDCEYSKVKQKAINYLDNLNIPDIIDIPLQKYLKLSKSNQRFLKGFRTGVEFSKVDVPIDPYFLGLWLGSDCSRSPIITTDDKEIIEYLTNNFPEYYVRLGSDSITKNLVSKKIEGNNIEKQLQNLNLIQNKHIPEIYLKNSRENRLKILAGLIDSYGYLGCGGYYEIVQKSSILTDNIEYLLRSLGARVQQKKACKGCMYKDEYKTSTYNRIIFTVDFDIPVLIERKRSTSNPNKDFLTNSIDVQPLGIGEYYGFELDGNHRYLLGDFTVTHNTLSAVTASQCYLDKHPDKKIVFIGPASLLSNFKKELESYGILDTSPYEFYSYDKFMLEGKKGNPISLKDKYLIIDEAHTLRNPKSIKSQMIVEAAAEANKRLLLTATPFVNKLKDFIPLINILYGRNVVGTKEQFYNGEVDEWIGDEPNEENIATIWYLLYDRVDVSDVKNPEDFPERIDYFIDVPMTESYYDRYKRILMSEDLGNIHMENPEKFYNGYRRIVNKAGPEYYSEKIKAILPILKRGHSVIYSNWLEYGTQPITDVLAQNAITFRVFSGNIPSGERQRIINDFNNLHFEVLIITKAGGEGIDLKGTKSIIVLEPTWNDASIQQVVGRAIRYKSHLHLPLEERKVDVYFMVLTIPKNLRDEQKEESGDKILYKIIEEKVHIGRIIDELLKDVSIK